MKKVFLFVKLLIFLVSAGFAQSSQNNPGQLAELLKNDTLTLFARGNGGSSGAVVYGSLKNNSSNVVYVDVNLNDGLFLINNAEGQNMIATSVFFADGGFYKINSKKFINLAPNSNTQIVMNAFCVDFEKKNPIKTESFSLSVMPDRLKNISSNISRYIANHLYDDDPVTPVQLAVWHTQGISQKDISAKFIFTAYDWEISIKILDY
ncbi:MAG: hypothetical protein LBH16_06840 [Treponema sp.]|nr:hypothetical protein [Treponema sp.]